MNKFYFLYKCHLYIPKSVFVVESIHDSLDPVGVTRESREYVRVAGLGASGSERCDAGEIPTTVSHIAVERAAAVAHASAFADEADAPGAQVPVVNIDFVAPAVLFRTFGVLDDA